MRALIRHVTEYVYPQPAWDSRNELRLKPAQDERQSLLSFRLQVQPGAEVTERTDYFGTVVHHVQVFEPHDLLRLETRSLIETHEVTPPPPTPAARLTLVCNSQAEFLMNAGRTGEHLDWNRAFGWQAPAPEEDLVTYLNALNLHLHARFTYAPGATSVGTPLSVFARDGRGVCQDYAHAMIAVCRQNGVPARYVSGYIFAGQDFVGAEATHAWVEAHVPGSGWLGLDPTNRVHVNEHHVKIGHGRDYDDVAPVRGVRRGGGLERLGVIVSVAPEPPLEIQQQIQQQSLQGARGLFPGGLSVRGRSGT